MGCHSVRKERVCPEDMANCAKEVLRPNSWSSWIVDSLGLQTFIILNQVLDFIDLVKISLLLGT